MTLNPDLFGNLVPDPPKSVPVSVHRSNKVRVYHGSWGTEPPHTVPHPVEPGSNYVEDSNLHESIIHAGTPEAVVNRENVHEYEVDLSHPSVSPVTWGDALWIFREDAEHEELKKTHYADMPEGYFRPRVDIFNENMKDKQEGLFENTPANVLNAVQTGTVLPYRNRREDAGSISYAIPKSAVGGAVRYIGVSRAEDFRKKHLKKGS